MDKRDLSELDRNTLRLWRATNLIGWGLAGIIAFVGTWILAEMVVRLLAVAPFGPVRLLAMLMGIVVFLLPPLVAGIVIGDHVYRWPGWTTIGASLFPAVAIALRTSTAIGYQEMAIILVPASVIGLITARVARARFESRPRALRSAS